MEDNKTSQAVSKTSAISTHPAATAVCCDKDCDERHMAHAAGVVVLARNLTEAQRINNKRASQVDRLK